MDEPAGNDLVRERRGDEDDGADDVGQRRLHRRSHIGKTEGNRRGDHGVGEQQRGVGERSHGDFRFSARFRYGASRWREIDATIVPPADIVLLCVVVAQ